jgi:hypothetical protein
MGMKRALPLSCTWILAFTIAAIGQSAGERTISYTDYLDKVHGGWIGKAIGLIMGVPKEYGEPWPPSDFEYYSELPTHFSDRVSGDDIYIPLVNQLALKKYGVQARSRDYMEEWKARLYSGRVWVSCEFALDLAFSGITPPKTGFPGYNGNWDDMCAQIGLDNIGWSAPGLINTASAMADEAGHVINWGEGADGGVFTAAVTSEAFFTRDIEALIRKARSVLPAGSLFGEMVDDVLRLHRDQPDWRVTRQILARKYNRNLNPKDFTVISATGIGTLIGLLYGDGDFGKSMVIAQKCRWDSDCTAATVAGTIGTILGYSRIDPKWTLPVRDTYENYCIKGLPHWMTFLEISRETTMIGEKVLLANGGRVTGEGDQSVLVVPAQSPKPLLRQEIATPELIAQGESEVLQHFREKCRGIADSWDPQWALVMASFETKPEVLDIYMNRPKVLKVQPGPRGAILERTITLSPHMHHYLKIGVAHHPRVFCEATGQKESGSWNLEVQVEGKKIGGDAVGTQGGFVVWEDPQFDLTPFAGKTIQLKLIAHQGGYEFSRSTSTSYWSKISLLSMDQPEPWRNDFRPLSR